MGDVIMLVPRERMNRDVERLLSVNDRSVRETGAPPAAIDMAMEDLAETLSRVAVGYRDRRLELVATTARDAADQARLLGLNRAFRVGQTVAALAQQGDGVALAANVARLMRLGDAALSSVWSHRDTLY